jgi:hypothetical protein
MESGGSFLSLHLSYKAARSRSSFANSAMTLSTYASVHLLENPFPSVGGDGAIVCFQFNKESSII